MEKIRTTVRIAGRDYTMTGTESEEHMHRVAVYVDRKMEEISLATQMPTNMVSVLAAMNVTDELLKAKDENTRLRKELMLAQQQLVKQSGASGGTKSSAKQKAAEA